MLSSFIALYTAVFFLMTGVGLLGTYLPLRLAVEGASTQVVGYVMSAYFLGMFLGTFWCQKLVRVVGHIRAYAAFAAVFTGIVMLHGLLFGPLLWGVLRFFAGISTIGIYMVIESWLNECAEPRWRGRVLSIYMVLTYLGMSLGQQLLNLAPVEDVRLIFVVGLLLVLSMVPVAVTRAIHPEISQATSPNFLALLSKAPVGMLGCFAAGLTNSAFYAITPVYCHQLGMTVAQLSLVMTVTIGGGLLLQWPVGSVSDRFDRTYVLCLVGLLTAALSFLITIAGKLAFWQLLLVMGVFGGLIFAVYPLAIARAHDLFAGRDIVPVSAALLFCYGVGATIGPAMASNLMYYLANPSGLFIYFTAVAFIYAATIFLLRKKELVKVVPPESNSEFVSLDSTSPLVIHLDPRHDGDRG